MGGLFGFLGGLLKPIGTYVSRKQEIKAAEHKAHIKYLENAEQYEHELNMKREQNRDTVLRRLSFVVVVSPYVIAIFAPEPVSDYFFKSLNAIPDYWQWMFLGMTSAIWGVTSWKRYPLKNAS